jgi:cytochrome c oxidase assembly factor CtaG
MDPVAAALRSWQVPYGVTAALLVTALVYVRGWAILRRQMPERFGAAQLVAFAAGLLAVFVALASPLDAFATLLLQVHMAQHILLTMVAPPLLWLGAPATPLLRGLPQRVAKTALGPFLAWPPLQRAAHWLAHPLVAWTTYTVTVIGWHFPGPYQLALRSPGWHQTEHLAFLAVGLLFWWPVIQPWPSRPVWPRWMMIPYLLLGDAQNTILSAFFAFSDRVIYPAYAAAPRLWDIAPLDDQATAGALMWVVGAVIFLLPIALIVVELLNGRMARPSALARATPAVVRAGAPARRPFDLLTVPVIGALLRWRHGRRALQLIMLALALAVIVDGFRGPQMSPMNLAGVLPWTYWRGLVVLALLIGGNFFCMACPFMLPRELAKRLLPARRAWPRWLRTKWLAAGLLAFYLWAYEAFAPWDSPWWTAAIAVGYFAAAFAIDGLFRGASFCKYVCPIGQFNFVQSLVSPLTVRPRALDTCRACTTHDCIRGNARQRGCELELFQPEKRGNLDCTFCLDCVAACPHDNVGILAASPARDLARDPYRSSLRRLSERPDVAALVLVSVFGAFANAAGMVTPVLAWERSEAPALGLPSTLPLVTAFLILALVVVPAAATLAAAWTANRLGGPAALASPRAAQRPGPAETMRANACRFALALVPLGLGMWAAHFVFHLLAGGATVWPVLQRVATDLGTTLWAAPMWAASQPAVPAAQIVAVQLLFLDFGLLLSLYTGWRIAARQRGRGARAAGMLLPWAVLMVGLWIAGAWIVFQPMDMRGMVH